MEKALYDTNVLIEAAKSGKSLNGYTTVLNVVEFRRALELGLKVITRASKTTCSRPKYRRRW